MAYALSLAKRGLGRTAPNPSVGCVIVKNQQVIGIGHTAPGGRPHAETQALVMAGEQARGATLYVTLEPCCHTGLTPPCTNAIIASGITRVVIATTDCDPRVAGKSKALLENAGIIVSQGIYEEEAIRLNVGFFSACTQQRPWIHAKLATSLDGKIATSAGESQWITNAYARQRVQLLRSQHEALLTGVGTIIADNPSLTCRLPGYDYHNPIRIILDSTLRIPLSSQIVRTALQIPTWIITTPYYNPAQRIALEQIGVKLLITEATENQQVFLPQALNLLATSGITRVMVEAGNHLLTSLLRLYLIDALTWMRAPLILGNDGKAAIDGLNLLSLKDSLRFKRLNIEQLGEDILEYYEKEM